MNLLKKLPTLFTANLRRRLKSDHGLINTADLLVSTAITVTLAAGVSSAMIDAMDDARYGKAQPDAQAIANSVVRFYKDTGMWPGQAEHAALTTMEPLFLVSNTAAAAQPSEIGGSLSVAAPATCGVNSAEGFANETIPASNFADATKLDLNNYLVHRPNPTLYPNWRGPYLEAELRTDPWERSWVLNLQALYCAEEIPNEPIGTTGSSESGGNLGYAWIISGGTNKTVSTVLSEARLDPEADDAGTQIGKLLARE
jgi:hypothetical protein